MTIPRHIDFGNIGENQAYKYYIEKGYKVLKRNYTKKFGEIDIIAEKDNLVIICEVKRRKSNKYGFPREAVDIKKQRQIIRMTQCFLQEYELYDKQVRFDVIEIMDNELNHIENAFIV